MIGPIKLCLLDSAMLRIKKIVIVFKKEHFNMFRVSFFLIARFYTKPLICLEYDWYKLQLLPIFQQHLN